MQHFYVILILATFACANSLPEDENQNQADKEIQPRILEDKIKKMITDLLEKIGDPAVLENKEIHQKTETLQLDLTATGTITGLQGLDIQALRFSLAGFKLNFDVLIPMLNVNITSYDLEASFDMLPLSGAGTLTITAQGLRLTGSGQLGSKDGLMFVKALDLHPSLKISDFFFELTGWAHDDNLSKVLSKLINDMVETVVSDTSAHKALSNVILKLVGGITFKPPIG